jgi:hypothetical protein
MAKRTRVLVSSPPVSRSALLTLLCIPFLAVAHTQGILIYNEELLIACSFFLFVVTCVSIMASDITLTFAGRREAIASSLKHVYVQKERKIAQRMETFQWEEDASDIPQALMHITQCHTAKMHTMTQARMTYAFMHPVNVYCHAVSRAEAHKAGTSKSVSSNSYSRMVLEALHHKQ